MSLYTNLQSECDFKHRWFSFSRDTVLNTGHTFVLIWYPRRQTRGLQTHSRMICKHGVSTHTMASHTPCDGAGHTYVNITAASDFSDTQTGQNYCLLCLCFPPLQTLRNRWRTFIKLHINIQPPKTTPPTVLLTSLLPITQTWLPCELKMWAKLVPLNARHLRKRVWAINSKKCVKVVGNKTIYNLCTTRYEGYKDLRKYMINFSSKFNMTWRQERHVKYHYFLCHLRS
jgi:hypothetical protein